ncbi:hypothetical protein D3C75_1346460 [compost metagenome]
MRLNQPKKPRFGTPCSPFGMALSMVAQSAGVKIRATRTERAMAETMVIENCL